MYGRNVRLVVVFFSLLLLYSVLTASKFFHYTGFFGVCLSVTVIVCRYFFTFSTCTRVHDVKTGEIVRVLHGHTDFVTSVIPSSSRPFQVCFLFLSHSFSRGPIVVNGGCVRVII